MDGKYFDLFKGKLDKINLDKLLVLNNAEVMDFVAEYAGLCRPERIFVRTDSQSDSDFIREEAVRSGEEGLLRMEGHTFHFDGCRDQARDKKNTKYLLPAGKDYGPYINSTDREEGIAEVRRYLKDIMRAKVMYVCFFCLGPVDSRFSVSACQITDSAYVAHSEDILYRPGYEQFKHSSGSSNFFKFVHSAGRLRAAVSENIDRRRVYIDLENDLVYSVNTQYAGNTVGLKKLALRLAIKKAGTEGWLAEHMFVMGVHNREGKKAYFCGAYPSMCGKTSTAMLKGETIVGDDIAYIRAVDGAARAVNVERGIFGIIKDVNAKDDAILFKTLSSEGEVIFSNVLVDETKDPYWTGKDDNPPACGENFSGRWHPGKTGAQANTILPSHKNARYTIRLSALENVDPALEDGGGVIVSGLIYGGRDSDISVPVAQALSWRHGIVMKAAALESETTAATLGKEGVRVFNPMSNIDFISVSLGKYIDMNLKFAGRLEQVPLIFSANYFLRNARGEFYNAIEDKRVWLKWMRARVDRAVGSLLTPCGLIPEYRDLKDLFRDVLGKDYSTQDYIDQFSLRIPQNLAKIERIRKIYKDSEGIPPGVFAELDAQEKRLKECRSEFGDYVAPEKFKEAE